MLGAPMQQPPKTKRSYLRQLVAAKNLANRPLTEDEKNKGFLGWHERGYLPHCDYPDLVQFVTFRLGDSMPASRRGEWEHLLKIENVIEKRTKLEEYLDRGHGQCHLRNAAAADLIEEAMLFHHDVRHELLAWVIMPNHVHVLVHIQNTPLSVTLQNWKSISAKNINRLLGRSGEFWEREYWDTFIRDSEQLSKAIRYIEGNPVKAKLCRIAKDWPFSSARFRDEYGNLALPCIGAPSIRSA